MSAFFRALRAWGRGVRAEAVVHSLERSRDRAAKLAVLQDKVDDRVLSGMLDLSYLAEKRGDDKERLAWADLAVQASLLGGTSKGRAEALLWHARVLFKRGEPDVPTDLVVPLIQAARSVDAAVDILREIGSPDELFTALSLQARIHGYFGKPKVAFDARLACVRIMLGGTNDEQTVTAIGEAVAQYWWLRNNDAFTGGSQLLDLAETLSTRLGDQAASADLRVALGDVHRRLGNEQAAVDTWAAARTWYCAHDDRKGMFEVDEHLFEYAVERGLSSEARELGIRCLAGAPPDTGAARLAEVHHLLGAALNDLGAADEAIAEYQRAIQLAGQVPGTVLARLYRLDLALLKVDAGQYSEAIDDLEVARQGTLDKFDWLASQTLAEIHLQHLGNVAAAASHADSALRSAITGEGFDWSTTLEGLTCRANSLQLSGFAHFVAGDVATAYQRFADLMRLQADVLPTTTIDVGRTRSCPVDPPLRANSAWWAYITSEQTGRHDEAAVYQMQCAEFAASGETLRALSVGHDGNTDPDVVAMIEGIAALSGAAVLVRTHPQQALERLDFASGQLLETGSFVLANIDVLRGGCHLRLGKHAAARAAFRAALANLDSGATNSALECNCHAGLALSALAEGDLIGAEEHLTRLVELTERTRMSMNGVDERMRYLVTRLWFYETLVMTRVNLNRPAEAYEALQLIKSRTLGELLAEPEHRPIDYELEDDLIAIGTDWNEWISTNLRTNSSDDETALRLLQTYVDQHDRLRKVGETQKAKGVFDGLVVREPPLTFPTVKELLHP